MTPAPQGLAPRAVTDGHTVLATADVPAQPDRVFQALNTAELERWWGSADTYRMTEWTADVRVAGRWHVLVRGAEGGSTPVGGKALPAGGEFLEVDSPHKIVFTRKYAWDFPVLGQRETTVTYLLDPVAEGTRVTVRHDGFAGLREPADLHADGWERVLGWLQSYLSERPATDRPFKLNVAGTDLSLQSARDVAALVAAFGEQLDDPTRPFGLVVRFTVPETAAEQLRAAFARMRMPTLGEPGCLAFELNREARVPGGFVVHEQWRSLADFESHHRTAYTTRLRHEVNALILGAPEFHVLLPVSP